MEFLGARQDIVVVLLCLMPWLVVQLQDPGETETDREREGKRAFYWVLPFPSFAVCGF